MPRRKLFSSAASLLRRPPHLFAADPQSLFRDHRLPSTSHLASGPRGILGTGGFTGILIKGGWIPYTSEPHRGTATCWNCGAAGAFLACSSCRSVQPVDSTVDYFQIFGLERTFEIQEDSLEGKYKDWQKKLHPDLVHSKTEKERTFAAEQSARVIDAYRTLLKPLSRALYLLKLEGVHVDDEKTVADPELLAEMMEMREAVEDAEDPQALKEIQSQIWSKYEDWSKTFQEAFKKSDFDLAIIATQRMRYYDRAIEEIVKKL